MKLEDLPLGASIRCILPDAAVSMVSVQWYGSDALTLVYRSPSDREAEHGEENAADELVAKLGSKAEATRELACRPYTMCERKKLAAEALSYNGLVRSFPEITRLAREGGKPKEKQSDIPNGGDA
jgi:hypothetical protein